MDIIVKSPYIEFTSVMNKVKLSIEDANTEGINIKIRPNYYDGFLENIDYVKRDLHEFITSDALNSDEGAICPETPLPPLMASSIHFSYKDSLESSAYGLLHVGAKNAIAPLHFDWDFHWVVNACTHGKKSFIFFPPQAGWLLNPIINTSSYDIPRLSKKDIKYLMNTLNGRIVTISKGQGVIFPSIWWHAVIYDETSMSVSVRFNENKILRPLAVLPRSFWLQRLIWMLLSSNNTDKSIEIINNCLSLFFDENMDWLSRYIEVNSLYRQILYSSGQEFGSHNLQSLRFNSELSIATDEISHSYSVRNVNVGYSEQHISEACNYIFDGDFCRVSEMVKRHTAIHALQKRQGLRPVRGIIKQWR